AADWRGPAAEEAYAATARIDWLPHSRRRAWALPMVMLRAERLINTSAPARAAWLEGGTGTQMSSQISTWKVSGTPPVERNSMSVPNGTSWPPSLMESSTVLEPETKWRFS